MGVEADVVDIVWDDDFRTYDLLTLDREILYPNGLKTKHVFRWECDKAFTFNYDLFRVKVEDNVYG